MAKELFRIEDLVNNPIPRIAICLCLDVSGSMVGAPIAELNKGVHMFYDAIKKDDIALYAAEICIVTFGSNNGVECIADFANLTIQPNAPTLRAYGSTPMGEAVNLGLDLLEQRKSEYKSKGIDYYQPWFVLMTDGAPNGSASELSRAINRVSSMVNKGKLSLIPIGIGKDADMSVLKQFSPKRSPLKLKGLKFCEFFQWLSQSVSRTSMSKPGDKVPIYEMEIKKWSDL